MKIIKNICPHCEKAIELTKKELILYYIKNIFLTFFVMMGIIFVFFLSVNGLEHTAYQLSEIQYTRSAIKYHDQVRFLAVNITKECTGMDTLCLARELYYNMSGIRYIPDSRFFFDRTYHPLYVYEHGDDCEGLAQMYVAFAKSVGVNARVQCGDRHCVAIVTDKWLNEEKDIVVDLTMPLAYYLNENERFTDVDREELVNRAIWR